MVVKLPPQAGVNKLNGPNIFKMWLFSSENQYNPAKA